MTIDEILRDAEDMAKHYPDDRLRLTGVEILAFRDAMVERIVEAARNVFLLVDPSFDDLERAILEAAKGKT